MKLAPVTISSIALLRVIHCPNAIPSKWRRRCLTSICIVTNRRKRQKVYGKSRSCCVLCSRRVRQPSTPQSPHRYL